MGHPKAKDRQQSIASPGAGHLPRIAAKTSANVRFGICGINDFNKLILSRKPSVRSEPQRLFGAVSRKQP
jgi:hypothetical protein